MIRWLVAAWPFLVGGVICLVCDALRCPGAARALHWRNQRAVTIIERYCVSHQLTLITSPALCTPPPRRCPGLSRFEKSGDYCFDTFRGGNSLVETALIAVA
ncbi:3-hydroxyanthranilate 3,4-dioxygenase [Dirofilaria immitis]